MSNENDATEKAAVAESKAGSQSKQMVPAVLGCIGLAVAFALILNYQPSPTDKGQIDYSNLPEDLQSRVIALNRTVNELHRDISVLQAERAGISTGALTLSGDLQRITTSLPDAGLAQLPRSLNALSRKLESFKSEAEQ